jgi:hypothetical protein
VGVSDAASPSAFGDFRTQMGVNPAFGDTVTRPFMLVSIDDDGPGPEGINRFPVGQDNPHFPALRSVPMAVSEGSRQKQIPSNQQPPFPHPPVLS